jgi:hypothetical protein
MQRRTVTGTSEGPGRGQHVLRAPSAAGGTEPGGTRQRTDSAPVGGRGLVPRKILVVDDNQDVVESLALWLATAATTYGVAWHTGEVALEKRLGVSSRMSCSSTSRACINGRDTGPQSSARTPELAGTVLIAVTATGRRGSAAVHARQASIIHWVKPLSFRPR